MSGLPDAGQLALAALVVGSMFLVRFLLSVWRIRQAARSARSFVADARDAFTSCAFGTDLEPERRAAVRQFCAGVAILGALFVGVALAVSYSVLRPFLERGFGG